MTHKPENRVLHSARREALAALLTWAAALAYTIIYCSKQAYNRDWETMTFVLGFPDWVFYGIIAPWGVCLVLSWWYAFFYMTDEDLGPESAIADGDAPSEEPADAR